MPDDAQMHASLTDGWDIVSPGITLKRYGACGCTHCALDAMVSLKLMHAFEATQIQSIECISHPLAKKVLQHSRPVTGLEAKFSMEYSMAIAALVGMPTLSHYDDAWVRREDVRDLVKLVRFEVDDDLAKEASADAVPAVVTVRLRDGRAFSERVDVPLGDTRRPMSDADRQAKFDACVSGSADRALVASCWERMERLDGEKDFKAFWALLSAVA